MADVPQVLILEDEWMVGDHLASMVCELDLGVVGPVPSAAAALELVRTREDLHLAILDCHVQDGLSTPVAEELRARGIPFLFLTGYTTPFDDTRWDGILQLKKPVAPRDLHRSLNALLGR